MRVGLPKNIGTITDAALYKPSEEYRNAAKAEAETKMAEAAAAAQA